jgi:ActR/RegA family two-component response regulator
MRSPNNIQNSPKIKIFSKEQIEKMIFLCGQNITETARRLKISRRDLQRILRRNDADRIEREKVRADKI